MANHLPVDATSGVNQVLVDRKLARFPVAVRFRTGRAPGRWFGRHARFEALWARACRTWQAAGRVREARCRVHSRTTDEGGLVTLNPARPAKDLEDGTMAAETGFGNSHYRTRLDPELPAPGQGWPIRALPNNAAMPDVSALPSLPNSAVRGGANRQGCKVWSHSHHSQRHAPCPRPPSWRRNSRQ